MTKAVFTPGPWAFDGKVNITAPDPEDAGQPWHVAILCDFVGYGKDDKDANAHLIAAAPNLYEAVAGLVAAYTGDWINCEEAIQRAKAALSKARGEQP